MSCVIFPTTLISVSAHSVSLTPIIDEDPETYGSSLVTLADVFPYFEPLVDRWFVARFITMKTIGKLCVQMCSYSVPNLSFPNASPPIIQSRLLAYLLTVILIAYIYKVLLLVLGVPLLFKQSLEYYIAIKAQS